MAIELGVAYISILPSTDKLAPAIRKELGKIEGDADKSGDRAGAKFADGFKSKMGAALKGGLLAGAAGISLLGGLGLKTAAEMEQADIAFTTMLGSAEKARAFIEDLTAFAAKTPFEFPGLQTAASSLISAGIATKDVIPIMTTLGDVTSGMGTGAEGIERATVAIQQMNAAGKVGAEDLNQLRDAGIPVYDLLAASMKKTKAEVVDMAQKGTLGLEGLQAIMSGLKTGKGLERFTGLMEQQAQSLNGQWSTFKDTLQMGLAEAIKPLIPLIKSGLATASAALAPILARVSSGLATGVTYAKAFADQLAPLFGWIRSNSEYVKAFAFGLGIVAAGFAAVTLATSAWAFALSLTGLPLIIAGLVAVGAGLYLAYKRSDEFRAIVDKVIDSVRSGFVPILKSLATFVKAQVIPAVVAFVKYVAAKLVPLFLDVAKVVANDVIPILQKIGAFLVTQLVPKIFTIVRAIAGSLKPIFDALVSTLRTNVLPAVQVVLQKFAEWWPTLSRVVSIVVSVVGWVLRLAAAILGKVLPPLIRFAGFLIGKVVKAIATVIGWVVKVIGWAIDLGAAFGRAAGAVGDAVGRAVGWVRQKFNSLVGFFRQMPGRMSSALSGLWDGLKNGFKSVINQIIGWWNNLHFSFDIPDKIPGLPDEFSINTPNVPMLAKGGILTKATLNVAGEAGPEAVIPLDRLDDMLARAQSAGAANAEGRRYSGSSAARSGAGSRRVELVITNWKTGEGYFREIATDTYHDEAEFDGTQRRMR